MTEEFDIPYIDGVKCNGFYEHGIEQLPVFDVDAQTYYQNISVEGENMRKRILPPPDSNLEKYLHSGTQASQRPFALRYTDTQGNQSMKKIR